MDLGFRTEVNDEVLMDRFDEMVTEVRRVDLVNNLEYALALQFVDRMEKSGKINSGEIKECHGEQTWRTKSRCHRKDEKRA